MDNENIKQLINDAIIEKEGKRKLPCAKAFTLVANNAITLKEIAEFCNANNIKISSCQLGCFK